VVIVTEPTLSGEHDLERVGDLAKHFSIPAAVCVNKYDLNPQITERIREKSISSGFHFPGTVRYDNVVTEAQIHKTTIIEYSESSSVSEDIRTLWRNILSILSP
jgi:MinD superfamily P-loop ATPase